MSYAINLADLGALQEHMNRASALAAGAMVENACPNRKTVQPVPDRPDEDAVRLEVDDEQAAAVCDVLRRMGLKRGLGKNKLRIYEEGPRGGWKRIKWANGPPDKYEDEEGTT